MSAIHYVMDEDEATATVVDSSGNGNDGAWSSGTSADQHSPESPGGSITASFLNVGTSRYIQITTPQVVTPTSVVAAGGWAKIDASKSVMLLHGSSTSNQGTILNGTGTSIFVTIKQDDGSTITFATFDFVDTFRGWHHWFTVFQADGSIDLYLDGNLFDTQTRTQNLTISRVHPQNLIAGGYMADWYYFDLIPTSQDIQGLYQLGVDSSAIVPSVPKYATGIGLGIGI